MLDLTKVVMEVATGVTGLAKMAGRYLWSSGENTIRTRAFYNGWLRPYWERRRDGAGPV